MSTLYYTIPKYFEARMAEHNCVAACTRVEAGDEVVYRIERTNGRKSLLVFLSDAYSFGQAEYLGRPTIIRRGDFVLVARPEGGLGDVSLERAKNDGIGIGKLAKLMGALNMDDVSRYRTPEEREADKRRS
ncbi:MAG TPA: hypothetical protein VIM02_02280 [Rhizomicrobium sp.]|jgi:hypothetical protein